MGTTEQSGTGGVDGSGVSAVDVLVVEDHAMVAESLGRVLAGIDVVGDVAIAGSGAAALERMRDQPADLVLLDLGLPDVSGMEVARELAVMAPEAGVVVVTAATGAEVVQEAIDAGCRGFVPKSADLDELAAAVTTVAGGEVYFTGDALRALVQYRSAPPAAGPTLSEREREVLQQLADGADVPTIADTLGLSVHTVRNHLRRAMDHLGVHSRLDAVVEAGRAGLIDLGTRS